MDDIIDLTGSDGEHDIVTSTGAGGLFGGTFLNEHPIAHYLEEDESPQYVVRNKKSGLTVDGEAKSETLAPDGSYQALAVVTDRRLLVVVGTTDGNSTRSLSMDEIFDARTGSGGFRTQTLEVESFDGDRWTFPTRSDPTEVADTIDAIAQSRVSAIRLLEEADDAIDQLENALPDAIEEGRTALETAVEKLSAARTQILDVGPASVADFEDRIEARTERLEPRRWQVLAGEAAAAHARGRETWRNREFEVAAHSYETAVSGYEKALEMDIESLESGGAEPPVESVRNRYVGAVRERRLLQFWPGIDADSTRRQALSATDTEAAASLWTETFDRYGGLLHIEWPGSEREFVAKRATIREQMAAVAQEAITDIYEAGSRQLNAGDGAAGDGRMGDATHHYETARERFEHANKLASQVEPDLLESLETALFTVERRLQGNIPDEPNEPVVPPLGAVGGDTDATAAEGESGAGAGATPPGNEAEAAGTSESSDVGSLSVIDQIKADTPPDAGAEGEGPTAPDQPGATAAESIDDGGFYWTSADDEGAVSAGSEADGTDADVVRTGPDDVGTGTDDVGTGSDDVGTGSDDVGTGTDGVGTGSESVESEPADAETDGVSDLSASTGASTVQAASDVDPAREGTDETGFEEPVEQASAGETDFGHSSDAGDTAVDGKLADRLRSLSEEAFTAFIADLWAERGWSTTVFSAAKRSVYDIVAIREDDVERRLLLWTVNDPDGAAVDSTAVKRCATTRNSSAGADEATLVTTGRVTPTARRRAEELDVLLVDLELLADYIEAAGFEDRIPDDGDGVDQR